MGGHGKDPRIAAKFDISKHSTCHDIHDGSSWEDNRESKRGLGRSINSKESDDCCEVQYDGDANTTPVRQKQQECIGLNSRIINLAVLEKNTCEPV